ncbi:MAG: hypothetical protein ACK5LO_08050 [Leucobacter sp.]
MAQAGKGGERKSSLASGWTVQADPADVSDAEKVGDPEAQATNAAPDLGSGAGSAAADATELADEADAVDATGQLSNVALVLLGVFGGLYLLYAWIWLSWAQFYAETNAALAESSGALGAVLQQIVFWAAPLAPILWFLSVLLLNRGAATWRIALWIGIGVVLLLPYPIFSGGGAS